MAEYYKLTEETKTLEDGVTVYRIECTVDFSRAKKGQKGGWVESERNLRGCAWVADEAIVRDYAIVRDAALVSEQAIIRDHAIVRGRATVRGKVTVCDHAIVNGGCVDSDYCELACEHALVEGMAYGVARGHYPLKEGLNWLLEGG